MEDKKQKLTLGTLPGIIGRLWCHYRGRPTCIPVQSGQAGYWRLPTFFFIQRAPKPIMGASKK